MNKAIFVVYTFIWSFKWLIQFWLNFMLSNLAVTEIIFTLYMKIIYVNCGERDKYGSDLRSNEHYLSSSEIETSKKFRVSPSGVWRLP